MLLKYQGTGLYSQGILFKPDVNDGLYKVEDNVGKYLLETFPKDFVLIEQIKPNKRKSENKPTSKKAGTKENDK
jgi:hypothetical protein